MKKFGRFVVRRCIKLKCYSQGLQHVRNYVCVRDLVIQGSILKRIVCMEKMIGFYITFTAVLNYIFFNYL